MTNVKCNFKNGNENLECQLGCGEKVEDQQHILVCEKLMEAYPHTANKLNYNDLFGSLRKQKEIVTIFRKLLNVRETLLET